MKEIKAMIVALVPNEPAVRRRVVDSWIHKFQQDSKHDAGEVQLQPFGDEYLVVKGNEIVKALQILGVQSVTGILDPHNPQPTPDQRIWLAYSKGKGWKGFAKLPVVATEDEYLEAIRRAKQELGLS